MATEYQEDAVKLMSSDLRDLRHAANNLAKHAIKLGGLGFGTSFLQWLASIAAIYLLVLDRTNWKTNILTSLLIPYIYLSLPSILFSIFSILQYQISFILFCFFWFIQSGEIGKWIAFIAVVLRLFFPRRFPDWLELPGALILLIVVAPSLFSSTLRHSVVGVAICLGIACYLLQEHIRASGGFRNSFTKAHGISNSIGIILLLVYPVWAIVLYIL
ncbi:cold-regulated 413 plasma membrane protein 2-like [Senna tora]|uniref:Cold-regulated 413 plasma membrane protein 2-like n=1 Tax=Senna tora TaxID=362788 RepID=A0A835CJ21_9FABA|nr:cold-regulated 413 plasma membrane protein 2-like [Senna tora]